MSETGEANAGDGRPPPALIALARLLAHQAVREWLEQQHGQCRIVDESTSSPTASEAAAG